MIDLISRKALGETMYEEVFLKDSDDQRWDSGCWIRYKLFERVVDSIPTIDAVPVVRCNDCKYYKDGKCFFTMRRYGLHGDWFCADGERKENV